MTARRRDGRDLDGRSVIVTGAGSGIGRAAAVAAGQAGAAVCVADLDLPSAEETAHIIASSGAAAIALRVDVADEDAVTAMVDATVSAYGQLDGAFNNAGIRGAVDGADTMTLAEFRRVMETNVVGVFLCQREELKAMYARGSGAIVNAASTLAQLASLGAIQYAASKHAVVGLTRNAALEAAGRGVRVNAVAPGTIETPLNLALAGGESAMRERWTPAYPMGRLGQPEEVGDVVVWLLGEQSSFVTGQIIFIEGGMMLR